MPENPSKDTPRSDATLPLPAELARQGGGERFGKFQLSKRLGAGVSHDLWQAWDAEKQEWLALRVWPRPAAGAKEHVLAAGKKARAAADPRIVAPAGGGLECGQLWFARPYFEALPVRDLPWQDGGTLARVAQECAEALAGAHAKGLAHGRVTAGNVLVLSREKKADGARRSPKGEGGWTHEVKLTEFGLEDGDAAGDVRGLGRIFCELTGQPAPGGGPTTKAAPGSSGDTTGVAKVKGDTTRDASSEARIAIDGALAGIFLRARDGQLDAAAMAEELRAWLGKKPAVARKRRWPAIAAAAAVIVIVAASLALRGNGAKAGAGEALAESERAESEGRLESALERARAAAAADPKNARAAEAVKRLEAAVAARAASLAGARSAEDAAREADRRLAEARFALRAAQEAARAPNPDRAIIDKPLATALAAIEAVLRARPEDASALRLLESAATLFEPGDLTRLPKDAAGRPILTPVLVIRADLAAWILSCWSPRGLGRARGQRSEMSYILALYPPAAGPAVTSLQPPDPATPGRVALSLASAPPRPGEPASSVAWRAAVRALLVLDPETALKAVASLSPSADDPLAPDLDFIQGAANPGRSQEPWKRAREGRPWDATFLLSFWAQHRSTHELRDSLAAATTATQLYPAWIEMRTARAWSLCWLRQYDEALQVAATASPDPEACIVTGLVHFSQGKYEEADRDFGDAFRIDPQHVLALVYRAEARLRLRNPKGALEDAEAAMRLDSWRIDAIHVRALARSAAGDRAGAISDCERAISLDPGDHESYRIRGWVHLDAGEPQLGLEDADRTLKLRPRDPGALTLRAMARLHLGQWDGAVEDAEQALQINSIEAKAEVVLGAVCLQRADQAGAREHCGRALRLSPGLTEAVRLRALLRATEGARLEAIEDATEVLQARPRDAKMLLLRARARLATGQLKGAGEDCDALLEISPRFVDALIIRARVKEALQASGAALDDLDRALALEPKNLEALQAKSEHLSQAGRHREAAEVMTRAMEIDPGSIALRVLRALYRDLAGDAAGAMADAEVLIRDAPRSAAGYYRRSSLLLKKGDLEGAHLDAIDGTRAEPGNAGIWRQLGDVYRAKNQKERAIEAYEAVIKLTIEGDAERVAAEAAIAKLKSK